MAGRAITRARKESGLVIPSDAIANGKMLVYEWLPECLNKTKDLAFGVMVQKTVTVEGKPQDRVYTQAPNLIALMYLIDRAMGKIAVERNPIDDALTQARTDFINMQLTVDFLQAQVKDMNARAERALIETSKWEQQFVTEDEQKEQLRELARAANRALMEMTPRKLEELLPGLPEPEEALARLRGYLGREQASILEDVLSGGKQQADDEEYE